MSMKPSTILALAAGLVLAACSTDPPSGSLAYKEGKLGNGSFLFKCDDNLACDRWSGSVDTFPTEVASGSNFELRFVAEGREGPIVKIGDKTYDGVTAQPVAPYLDRGPDGFTALRPGYGTVVAKDARGFIIDYATIKIVKPDGLVVYDASLRGSENPPQLETLSLKVDQRRSFRTVAERKDQPIAGALRVEWSSADPSIVQVESYLKGVVNLVAKSPGKTRLTVSSAALTKEISVGVTQ